jgi:hypothetical protein
MPTKYISSLKVLLTEAAFHIFIARINELLGLSKESFVNSKAEEGRIVVYLRWARSKKQKTMENFFRKISTDEKEAKILNCDLDFRVDKYEKHIELTKVMTNAVKAKKIKKIDVEPEPDNDEISPKSLKKLKVEQTAVKKQMDRFTEANIEVLQEHHEAINKDKLNQELQDQEYHEVDEHDQDSKGIQEEVDQEQGNDNAYDRISIFSEEILHISGDEIRGKWTKEDLILLRELVAKHGRHWVEISKQIQEKNKHFFSPDCIRKKYERMEKNT